MRAFCSRVQPGSVASIALRRSLSGRYATANGIALLQVPSSHPQHYHHHHEFHASTALALPVRRRRRKHGYMGNELTNDGEAYKEATNSKATKQVPITDKIKFETTANQLLDVLYNAIAPLKAKNTHTTFELTRGNEPGQGRNLVLDLGAAIGTHTWQVDMENVTVWYSSATSGVFRYDLIDEGEDKNKEVLKWRSTADGHDLVGMSVRDLIKTINGVPKL